MGFIDVIKCGVGMQSKVHTCKDDQSVALLCVPDLAASQQHVVQAQREAFPLPQHRPGELVQAVVRLLALYQSFKQDRRTEGGFNSNRKLWTIDVLI